MLLTWSWHVSDPSENDWSGGLVRYCAEKGIDEVVTVTMRDSNGWKISTIAVIKRNVPSAIAIWHIRPPSRMLSVAAITLFWCIQQQNSIRFVMKIRTGSWITDKLTMYAVYCTHQPSCLCVRPMSRSRPPLCSLSANRESRLLMKDEQDRRWKLTYLVLPLLVYLPSIYCALQWDVCVLSRHSPTEQD